MKSGKRSPAVVLVLTLTALLMLSCQGGVFNIFATDTPTPTLTFTPTPTFTPSPTATSTRTPSATPRPSGVEIHEQADGSVVFTDYENKFEITLPADWFILPLSAKDIGEIMSRAETEDPGFQKFIEAFKKLDPDVIRVIAINKNSKYVSEDFSTNISVTALKDNLLSAMPVVFVTGVMESQLERGGAVIIPPDELSVTNSNGVEVGFVEFKQKAPTVSGKNITVHSKLLVFQSGGAYINVQLTVPEQFAAELIPVLDEIVKSIKLLE